MFKGFIVMGVAFGAGYLKGYFKGQQHTKELGNLIMDLRDDEKAKEFFKDFAEYLKKMNLADVEVTVENDFTDDPNIENDPTRLTEVIDEPTPNNAA